MDSQLSDELRRL